VGTETLSPGSSETAYLACRSTAASPI
jgi:hypothetical protein